MLKIFVSQPMNGLTDEEISSDHEKIVNKLHEIFGENIEIKWSFDKDWPEGAGQLWGWGQGLIAMDGCDIYCNATSIKKTGIYNGCEIERIAANTLGMSIFELRMDDQEEETSDREEEEE